MVSLDTPKAADLAPVLGRGRLFIGVFLVCIANAFAITAKEAIAGHGVLGAALAGFGVSWAVWVALALALRLASKAAPAPISRADWAVAAGCVLLAAWPVVGLSAVAASVLAAWLIAGRDTDARLKAAGYIFLAWTINLLWARLMMLVLARPIEAFDAFWVGLIARVPVHGNVVELASGHDTVAIMAACTSVANASLALLLWLAVTRTFRPVPRLSELGIAAGLFLTVMVINIGRLVLMAQSRAQLHYWHGDVGAGVVVVLITVSAMAWALFGVRREALA